MAAAAHHRLFARAMALALTRAPVHEAVESLVSLARGRTDLIERAVTCASHADWQDLGQKDEAAALLELALHDLRSGLRATA